MGPYEELAHQFGFSDYAEMLENSFTVIYDYGVSWMATNIINGWLAWVDEHPDRPMKTFQTYDETLHYIHEVFEDAKVTLKELEEARIVQSEDFPIVLN